MSDLHFFGPHKIGSTKRDNREEYDVVSFFSLSSVRCSYPVERCPRKYLTDDIPSVPRSEYHHLFSLYKRSHLRCLFTPFMWSVVPPLTIPLLISSFPFPDLKIWSVRPFRTHLHSTFFSVLPVRCLFYFLTRETLPVTFMFPGLSP